MRKTYYQKRNNSFYTNETKIEILSKIDYDNPETFLPYLEKLDYPYLKEEWARKVKHGREHDYTNIFGRYIALMRLKGYRDFSFQDSNYLNGLKEKKYDFNS